jgi:zinc transport system ATP-binding protein
MTDPDHASVIRVRDGRFGYRNQVAVRADLDIHSGEVVALLGPNGSGKTTLLKGMLGLVERLGGSVDLFGQPLAAFHDRSLIGYVPQRQTAAGPIPVTVRELVRSGRLARKGLLKRRSSIDDRAVSDAIAAVGLADKDRMPVATLSGGQQRRALVARALAGGARVLLLDEPLAGVDQANQEALADALAAMVATETEGRVGVTIVVVLHELGPLESLVTRAVCLDSGIVGFDGSLETAPPALLHLGHDHDPHGGQPHRPRLGLFPT